MLILLSAYVATFLALFKGLMVVIGVLLGGLTFLVFVLGMLALGIHALIEGWQEGPASSYA